MGVRSMIGLPSMRHVDEAAPVPQNAQSPEARPKRDAALDDVFDGRKVSALSIGIVAIEVAAEDQAALIGLADVEVAGTECHDAIDGRLDALGDESLDDVALDRQAQPRHRRKSRGVAGDRQPDFCPRE